MKVSIFALAAAFSFVAAQNFGNEPACAIPCITSAIAVAGCAPTDQGCQCGSGYAAIAQAATPCLIAGCSPSDLLAAQSVAAGLCSAYSAGLVSNSATSTASSTQASTSTLATASITSTSSVIQTVSVTGKESPSHVTTSAATTKSVAATPSSGNKTLSNASSSPSSTSPPISSGAANGLAIGFGGVIAVVAGVAAVL